MKIVTADISCWLYVSSCTCSTVGVQTAFCNKVWPGIALATVQKVSPSDNKLLSVTAKKIIQYTVLQIRSNQYNLQTTATIKFSGGKAPHFKPAWGTPDDLKWILFVPKHDGLVISKFSSGVFLLYHLSCATEYTVDREYK